MKRSLTRSYFIQAEYVWSDPTGQEVSRKRITPLFHSGAKTLHELYHEYTQDLRESFPPRELFDMAGLCIVQFHAEPNELED